MSVEAVKKAYRNSFAIFLLLGKTPHFQGYIYTGDWRPMASTLVKLFKPYHFHIERANGTLDDNERYIRKGQMTHEAFAEWRDLGFPDPVPEDYGKNLVFHICDKAKPLTCGAKGTKVRLERDNSFYELVASGASDLTLAGFDFDRFCRCQAGIRQVRASIRPKRIMPMLIYFHYGPNGIGKTASIKQQFGEQNIYEPVLNSDKNSMNYAGYEGQPVLLLDEFYGKVPLFLALQILDPFMCRQVNAKYGQVWLMPKVVALTSNKKPQDWYNFENRREQEAALRRRFYDHAIVLDNFKKVTDMNEWWWIQDHHQYMPEKFIYDEFIPKPFVVPEVTRTVKMSDIVTDFEPSHNDDELINKVNGDLNALVASGELVIGDESSVEEVNPPENPFEYNQQQQDLRIRNYLDAHIGAPADYDDIVDYERVQRRMLQLTERITSQNVADLL